MDTNLGVIELTEKQLSRLSDLKTENIKGFAYWPGEKVVVTSLAPVDVEALKASIEALPDEDSPEVLKALEAKATEELIEAKKRELAIEALKVEGKLDVDAKITVLGKAAVELGKVG